ncbi:helix-turn-helix domain-containing protein [Sphingomonas sp. S2-65]|uniref:helix-turn-helix domain-containing protein n=1 Tax=Sphingomonas sp. S2-65 TaxID=2903960 RepID=UPI001F35D531|nr:helix-turn-helix domain-containing protein [Sphingomonas sp. S2-65]UYY59375.1 helix-turn-helix domain-containing protein [Sphingomonas sp. S2-65]
MAFSAEHLGDEMLTSISGPFRKLPDLLDALMRAVAEQVRPIGGSIRLRGVGTLVIGHHGGATATDWLSEPAAEQVPASGYHDAWPPAAGAAAVEPDGAQRSLRFPICYAGNELGELLLDMPTALAADDPALEALGHFARHCGLIVKRYEVRRWAEQRLGRPLMLVGMSKPLRDLERFLEAAARGDLPVLLRGEFGTEKALIAATIHCSSAHAAGPFFQVECADASGSPGSWIQQAAGGTLFLSGIDELDPGLQKQLPQYLPSRLDQWLPSSKRESVRLIASTTTDLHALARDGQFSRALLAELDFLSAVIPPLRERTGDIEALIGQALERNGYRAEEKRTDALVAMCKAHSWPENLSELERVIARLAVMTEGRPIGRGDIFQHAPGLFAEGSEDAEDADGAAVDASRWVQAALGTDRAALGGMHEALRRALTYLGGHHGEAITLPQLAWHANVSSSHLSYLFRTSIGMPFKALLCHIRVHRAREMLAAEMRRSITDVALSVGFADLSHFERSFRRIAGQSPRDFRRALGGLERIGAAGPRAARPNASA